VEYVIVTGEVVRLPLLQEVIHDAVDPYRLERSVWHYVIKNKSLNRVPDVFGLAAAARAVNLPVGSLCPPFPAALPALGEPEREHNEPLGGGGVAHIHKKQPKALI